MDAALSARYSTPFTPGSSNAPNLVRDICIDLTYWKAVGWKNEKLGKVMKDYIDLRLQQIVNGTIMLTSSSGLVAQGPTFAAATSDNTRSSFGVDAPENWSVSSLWQDEYASARDGDNP